MTSSTVVKKNHRRSLNKSLEKLSQRSSVKVPVDRFTVMNDNFNNDSGISEWRDEEMPAKKMECKKIYIYIQAHKKKKA